jgi:hypothetical protein
LGIGIAAAALQGYVVRVGQIPNTIAGWFARALLLAGAVFMAVPVPRLVGLQMPGALTAGVTLAGAGILFLYFVNRASGRKTA